MNLFDQIIVPLREKSGKKLIGCSIIVFLLITAIVFSATFELCRNIELKAMGQYLEEVPRIVDSLTNELSMRGRVYEDDVLTRAELGINLYEEESGLTDAEKLERVRSAVSAASISLLDGRRQMLATTGPASPEAVYSACIQQLEPHSPHLEFYPVLSDDGKETGENNGKGFVLIPVPGNTQRSLVFEFSCETMLEMYNSFSKWPNVLKRMMSGRDALAFAKTGDKLAGYPLDAFTPEQTTQLFDELTEIFRDGDSFRQSKGKSPSRMIRLLGERYLAALMHYPEQNTDILMAVPLKNVIGTGFYSAIAISAIIGLGMVLVQIYVFRRMSREKAWEKQGRSFQKLVRRVSLSGILVVIAVTILFTAMLLMLESRTSTSFTAMSKRESVQYEIDWQENQKDTIRSTYFDLYRERAQVLADYLSEHPEYQTHEGLKELNGIAGTDYLMRFDRSGQELVSSNSYTGFSVGTNLSEDYRAVLLGYPHTVSGPAADPYTGRMQLGTAILMTDKAGNPDGFLLAVYSAEDLNAEIKRLSYENTINSFAVQDNHLAAAVSDEDGRFIAHTKADMIGQKAESVLEYFTPGSGFEGFTRYKDNSVYLSAAAADGKTLLFMVPEGWDADAQRISALMAVGVVLVLALLYYPVASTLSAKAMLEGRKKLQAADKPGSPMKVFSEGYVIFLTILAIFALIASFHGWWPAFVYVFGGQWSKGVNLFSLWAALFVTAVTLCLAFLIRLILRIAESRLSLRAKTITRIADSLISYVAGIFLVFCVLDMFGVNTTTLLASAGVITITVGMGAQSMASDLLAGFFMMLEGSIHVGDHVSVAGITGHVTDMGIRTTEITDDDGNVVILNNSHVNNVLNMTQKETEKDDLSII